MNFLKIYKLLNYIKPNVVHTHLQASMYTVIWSVFHRNTVRLHTIHSMPRLEFSKLHIIVQKFAYKYLGTIPVSISEKVREEAADLYRIPIDNIPLIYNGIDIIKFRQNSQTKHDGFKIINVASFFPWKNQGMLINAFAKAYSTHKNMRLTFVGDGEKRGEMEQLCKSLDIYDVVEFVGVKDNVEDYLSVSDVFVLCSTFEGMPLSVLEAYASGLPVVATNVGGMPDIIKNEKNGFLVELDNIDELCNALILLCDNIDVYEQIKSNNISEAEKYDIKLIVKEYMKIYG